MTETTGHARLRPNHEGVSREWAPQKFGKLALWPSYFDTARSLSRRGLPFSLASRGIGFNWMHPLSANLFTKQYARNPDTRPTSLLFTGYTQRLGIFSMAARAPFGSFRRHYGEPTITMSIDFRCCLSFLFFFPPLPLNGKLHKERNTIVHIRHKWVTGCCIVVIL